MGNNRKAERKGRKKRLDQENLSSVTKAKAKALQPLGKGGKDQKLEKGSTVQEDPQQSTSSGTRRNDIAREVTPDSSSKRGAEGQDGITEVNRKKENIESVAEAINTHEVALNPKDRKGIGRGRGHWKNQDKAVNVGGDAKIRQDTNSSRDPGEKKKVFDKGKTGELKNQNASSTSGEKSGIRQDAKVTKNIQKKEKPETDRRGQNSENQDDKKEQNETKETGGAVDRKAQSDDSLKEGKEHNETKQTKGAVDRKAQSDDSLKEGKEHYVTKQTRGAVNRRAWSDESWKEQKEKYLNMPEEEKRRHYTSKSIGLNDVPTWSEYYRKHKRRLPEVRPTDIKMKKKEADDELNKKVSIWRGDITKLQIDCIVNAANESLLGGGGVDGAIHRAAGMNLKQECATLKGCQTGEAKITGGYKLPSKHIIHTVGPIGHGDDLLENCYGMSLSIMTENGLHSIAFPCISTGIYGFPADKAAHIALHVARTYLESNRDSVERIIFCLFMDHDVRLYEKLMQVYFPVKEELEASKDRTPSENSVKHRKGDTDAPAKQQDAAQKGQKEELTDSSENVKPKKNKLDPKQPHYNDKKGSG